MLELDGLLGAQPELDPEFSSQPLPLRQGMNPRPVRGQSLVLAIAVLILAQACQIRVRSGMGSLRKSGEWLDQARGAMQARLDPFSARKSSISLGLRLKR